MNVWTIAIMIAAFPVSWVLTGLVRRYALKHGILDKPNERSSHSVVTPRGGGLAIAVVLLGGIGLMTALGAIPIKLAMAISGGGLLVAGVGWIDDRRDLAPAPKLIVHILAALWALYWSGGLPALNLGVVRVSLHFSGLLLGVVGIVWSVNLYNFMDGIDGLAGMEAVLVAAVGGTLAAVSGALSLALVSWLLALASAGFLVWNWPPAKIFMGDVGSGLLGFTFAVLALASENAGGPPLLVWVLLLSVFIVDATATLIRRISRGERWYKAHRSHAYQLAAEAGYTHHQVALVVIAADIGLMLLAGLALTWPDSMLWVVLGATGALWSLHSLIQRRFDRAAGVYRVALKYAQGLRREFR